MSDEEIAQLEKEVSEQGQVVTQVKEVGLPSFRRTPVFLCCGNPWVIAPPLQHLSLALCHLDLVVMVLYGAMKFSAYYDVRGSPHDSTLARP